MRLRDGIAFAVRSMQIDFLRGAGIDDLLTVVTETVEVSGARLGLRQTIRRAEEPIVTADVVVVAIRGGRAVRLPAQVRAAFGRAG